MGVVPKRDIHCIQFVGSYYRVTFASIEAKEAFASAGLAVNGVDIPLHAPDNTTLVRVVRLPYEVSDANLLLSLGAFGSVTSVSYERHKTNGLCTGNRLERMRLDGVIPNRLHVSGYPCYVWYPGQPKRCHICQSSDHRIASCPNRGLFRICRKPGHVAAGCPDKPAGNSRPFSWGKPQAHSDSESDSGSEDYSSVPDGDDSEKLVMDESAEGEAVPSQEEGVSPMNVIPMVEVIEEGDTNTPSGSPSLFSSESPSANAEVPPVHNVSDPDPATELVPCPYSDHCALSVNLVIPQSIPRGPGYWKLNCTLLKDSDYCNSIRAFWSYWRSRKSDFPSLLWDEGKAQVKRLSIKHSSRKRSENQHERSRLEHFAAELKYLVDGGQISVQQRLQGRS